MRGTLRRLTTGRDLIFSELIPDQVIPVEIRPGAAGNDERHPAQVPRGGVVFMTETPSLSRYDIVVVSAPDEARTRSMLPIVQELHRRDHRITYLTTQEFAAQAVALGVDVLVHQPCPAYGPHAEPRECTGRADPSGVEDTLDCLEEICADFADDVPDLVLYETSNRIVARLLTCRWNRPAVQIFPSFAWPDALVHDDAPAREAEAEVWRAGLPEYTRKRLARFLSPTEHPGVSAGDFYTRAEPLSIALLPRAFQADGDLFDSRVAFVGPCIPERRMDERWSPPANGLPIVFLALDPELFHAGPAFLQNVVDVLAGHPVHVVVTTDGDVDGWPQGEDLPPNVEVQVRAPRAVVLRWAAAYICHPDLNNVMESLYFNTPLVAVPRSDSERAVADRVAELGLGVQLPPEAAAPEQLVDALLTLLGDLDTRCRVRALQREARRAGGARPAADEIERYLEWIYEP